MDIVSSDAFLDMPTSSRELYFQLGMYADDEGFVNPKKILRMTGASGDDLKVLIAKRFILPFKSGVVVIKHWLIHNTIRMDRFNSTQYQDEKNTLVVKDNKAYSEMATNGKPTGNQMEPQVKLSKVNLSKVKLIKSSNSKELEASPQTFGNPDLNEIINYLKNQLGTDKLDGSIKWNRIYAQNLLKRFKYDVDRVKKYIDYALSDPFHRQNSTTFKYLYNNLNKIAQKAKGQSESILRI